MKKVSFENFSVLNVLEDIGDDLEQLTKYKKHKNILGDRLVNMIGGNEIEGLLEVLLELMSLTLILDKDFGRNIKNFNANMVFTDKAGDFYVVAQFQNGKLKVSNKKQENYAFKLAFKDEKALAAILFSGAPDILKAMLNQEVDFEGNINYMNKFAYMALHLVLSLTGKIVYAD